MRKLAIFMLILALVMAVAPLTMAAGSASLSGPQVVRAGDTISLTFSAGGGITGGSCSLSYDASQLTLKGCSSLLGGSWKVDFNGDRVLFYDDSLASPITGSKGIFKATFQVRSDLTPGTQIAVTVGNIRLSDGAADTVLGSRTYTATLAEPLSDNCQLAQLTVTNASVSPAFSPNTTTYKTSVPFTTAKLDIQAKAEHSAAKVTISNNQLVPGETTAVRVTVTAENGATKVYTIQVFRAQDPNYVPSNNADLATLEVAGQILSPAFDSNQTLYYVWLPYETESVNATATAADAKAKVTLDLPQQLLPGQRNPITITVTAEDGTQKQYTVQVVRAPAHEDAEGFFSGAPIETPVEETEPTVPPTEETPEPQAKATAESGDDWLVSLALGLVLGAALGALALYLLTKKKVK